AYRRAATQGIAAGRGDEAPGAVIVHKAAGEVGLAGPAVAGRVALQRVDVRAIGFARRRWGAAIRSPTATHRGGLAGHCGGGHHEERDQRDHDWSHDARSETIVHVY